MTTVENAPLAHDPVLSPPGISEPDNLEHILSLPETVQVNDLQRPFSASLDTLPDLGNDKGLIAVVTAGSSAVKVYGIRDESGQLGKDMLLVTAADYDNSTQVSEDNVRMQFIPLLAGKSSVVGQDNKGMALRLGLANDSTVLGQQFRIGLSTEGNLQIENLDPASGTSVITSAEKSAQPEDPEILSEHLGGLAVGHGETAGYIPEFSVDGVNFRVDGLIPGNRPLFVMQSVDEKGTQRQFVIYRSFSEGGWRASQGTEVADNASGSRYIKGSELSQFGQYTQDTQLHPSVLSNIQTIAGYRDSLSVSEQLDILSEEEATARIRDFEEETSVYSFPDENLAKLLLAVSAGEFHQERLQAGLGVPADEVSRALESYVGQLNEILERSDLVPDFDQPPQSIERDKHPLLGPIVREVYTKAGIEWYMTTDTNGRVWIDRIRLSGSQATPYGTDQNLIFSGILTSKPIEHKKQVTGLPDSMLESVDDSYADMSRFLDTFQPIVKYRSQRKIER